VSGNGRRVRHVLAYPLSLVPRQAEVEDLDAAVGRNEDVGGFQVAVEDAGLMRGAEAVGNRRTDLGSLAPAEGPAPEPLTQRFALQQLCCHERPALVVPKLVDLEDVRVGELGNRLGFGFEASEPLGILCYGLW